MSRELATRVALLAYPPDVRDQIGTEMSATLLDASAGSPARFTHELVDLTWLGLRSRAQLTAAAGARRVIADGVCLAGVWLMTLDLSTLLAQTVRGVHDPLLAPQSLLLLGLALALALVGHDRLAGAAGLGWVAARFPTLLDHRPGMALAVTVATLPALACFTVLIVGPRRRARDPRRLAWLIVPATLVIAFGPPKPDQSPLLLALVAIGVLIAVIYVLATLTTDPRAAIAGAVSLGAVGLGAGSVNVLVSSASLVLVIALAMLGQRRRQVPT
jgi:hypothetical protein